MNTTEILNKSQEVYVLGYVTIEKPELKIREYEIYSGYYCGVCKSISRRYGNLPRFVLSYDAAFLALLIEGIIGEGENISREHCLVHPVKKKTIIRNKAIDYSGDIMLILAWHKFKDNIADEGSLSAKIICGIYKGLYHKLDSKYSGISLAIQQNLIKLSSLEKEKTANIDMVSDEFAEIMKNIFLGFTDLEDGLDKGKNGAKIHEAEGRERLVAHLGYHLGKWIYLIDAWEDIEENINKDTYNPLLYRFAYDDGEKVSEFRDRIREKIKTNLLIYLSEMAKAVDMLDIGKNKDIIENVIYMGLLRRTEQALEKTPD